MPEYCGNVACITTSLVLPHKLKRALCNRQRRLSVRLDSLAKNVPLAETLVLGMENVAVLE